MSTVLSRIQELASNEKITIGALERRIGASKGVLSRAINNSTDIQSKWIQNIVENYPQYSAQWLLTGEGSMLKTDQELSSSSESETITVSREAWDIIKRQAESLERKDAQISDLISILKKINVQQDAPAACADAN